MLTIHNNPSAALRVRWPKTDAEIFSLAVAFIAYEDTLTSEQQLKDIPLSRIQAAYTSALAGVSGVGSGEAARAIAAEILRQKYELARTELDTAISHLRVKYRTNLAQLALWGLRTAPGPRGVIVYKPRNQADWLAFLQAYIAKEASLPVADQLTVPVLAQMQTLNADIQDALLARFEGRTAREIGVQERSAATNELESLLRLACAIIVTARFDGEITNELQHWGFTVAGRPSSAGNGNGTPPEGDPPTAS